MSDQIAKTILQQMGGLNKIAAMTGAYNFLYGDRYVSWAWPARGKKPNRITIKLTRADDYNIEFSRYSKKHMTVTTTHEFKGIYFDQLAEIFEETTGLRLSL